MKLCDQSVLVMGMGRSGVSAAKYALSQGAHVTVTDLRTDSPRIEGANHTYGEHNRSEFVEADLIIVSPGIPASAPDIVAAQQAGVRVISELAFAAEILQERQIPIIAVTGTNGKSSVTWFIGQLLNASGHSVFVGGNFGTALTDLVASGDRPDFAVVEVSSYQLELPGKLQPTAAAVLNLSPDHLGRHGTMETYANTKSDLFRNMCDSGYAALPQTDANNPGGLLHHGDTAAQPLWLDGNPGVSRNGMVATLSGTPDDGVLDMSTLNLLGQHNQDNAAAAALLCVCAGVARNQLDFSTLTALPHRLQPVHEANGVTWVNDSKATNVDAALVGISGIRRPMIVLLGGAGKPGADYSRLEGALLGTAKCVVCFGDSGADIAAAINIENMKQVPTLSDAVHTAAQIAEAPDVVLLSPACASFDEFNNFEERGHAFTSLAQEATQ
mgnify:CR=1 FL=1